MRIAHVTATFPPYKGGTGNVCWCQTRALAAAGHDVHVFTSAYQDAPELERVAGMVAHRLRPVFRLGNAPLLPGLVRALRPFDIIHLHAPFIFGAEMVAAAAKAFRIPLVVTYHNDFVPDGSWRDLVFRFAAASIRYAVVPRARQVLFVSTGHMETNRLSDYARSFPDRCQVLENGVDCDSFYPAQSRNSAKQKLGLPGDSAVVGFVGGLDHAHHYKGLEVLLKAFATGVLDDVYLYIVGDGSLKRHFEEQSRLLGIQRRVTFHGEATYDDLPDLYRSFDVVALPSLAAEAFPLVIVEAFASGVPVVASDWPGTRSVLSHKRTGLLVNPGDVRRLALSLAWLVSNPAVRGQMETYARQVAVDRYAWKALVGSLVGIYERFADSTAHSVGARDMSKTLQSDL